MWLFLWMRAFWFVFWLVRGMFLNCKDSTNTGVILELESTRAFDYGWVEKFLAVCWIWHTWYSVSNSGPFKLIPKKISFNWEVKKGFQSQHFWVQRGFQPRCHLKKFRFKQNKPTFFWVLSVFSHTNSPARLQSVKLCVELKSLSRWGSLTIKYIFFGYRRWELTNDEWWLSLYLSLSLMEIIWPSIPGNQFTTMCLCELS